MRKPLKITTVLATFTPLFGWAVPLSLGTCSLSTESDPTRSGQQRTFQTFVPHGKTQQRNVRLLHRARRPKLAFWGGWTVAGTHPCTPSTFLTGAVGLSAETRKWKPENVTTEPCYLSTEMQKWKPKLAHVERSSCRPEPRNGSNCLLCPPNIVLYASSLNHNRLIDKTKWFSIHILALSS